jgi:hypothetical protein
MSVQLTRRDDARTKGGRKNVRLRDLSVAAVLPLWIALALLLARLMYYFGSKGRLGTDAHAYWFTAHHGGGLYTGGPMTQDAYLYSPAFAQTVWLPAHLPWPAFITLWVVAETLAFIWLLKPLGLAWGVPALLLCGIEIEQGNINGFVALALVLGMRWSGTWALPLLTKVTIGLGPVWFLARREWRALGTLALTLVAIVGVSIAISPSDWSQWFQFLDHKRSDDPLLPVRVAVACGLTVFAARRNRPWLLAPALVIASPVLQGIGQYLSLLAAIPRLRAMAREPEAAR